MKRVFFVLVLGTLAAPAVAQTPGWLSDQKTGCKMWARSVEHLNGVSWTGACVDGLLSGPGNFTLTLNGAALWTGTGTFVKGKREGHGAMKASDGYSFESEYRDGEPDGHTVERTPAGDTFEGEYHHGGRNGPGIYVLQDGARYVGNLKDNENDGQGTLTFPNGASYAGEWKASMPDGQGVYRGPASGEGKGTWSGRWRDGCFLDGETPEIFRKRTECAAKK
jgi:hypothetical protein